MRNLKAVLVAVLLAAGMVEAGWVWAPPSYVPWYSGVTAAYTASNNARCVAGKGSNVHVVYTGLLPATGDRVFYRGSTNLGLTWPREEYLSQPVPDYEQSSPSIVLWPGSDTLLAAWNRDTLIDGLQYPWQVLSRVSGDTGVSWKDCKHATQDEEDAFGANPTLACADSQGKPIADIAWSQEEAVNNIPNWHIDHNWHPTPVADVYWDDANHDLTAPHSHASGISNWPAVWDMDTWVAVSFQFRDPDAQVDSIWEHYLGHAGHPASSSPKGIDAGTHPSTCLSRSPDSTYETVAYEQLGKVSIALRDFPYLGNQNPQNPWAFFRGYCPSSFSSCYRPNLFSTQHGDTGWTYMALTGVDANGGKSTFFVTSTDGGQHWSDPVTRSTLDSRTDSVSLWAERGSAASVPQVTHRVTTVAVKHTPLHGDSLLVRVASVYLFPPTSQDAVGGHGARLLVRQPGTNYLHHISTIENYISYEYSSDNGATWNYQDAPDFGTNPSIALCNGNPTITYLRNDSVLAATLNSDSEWTIRTLYAGTSTSVPGTPSLAMFSNTAGRPGNLCFPLYDAGTGHSKIIYIQFDTTGASGVKQNTVDDYANSFADSACCVAAFSTDTAEVVYQHGSTVLMRRLVYSSATSNPPPDTWPQSSLVSTGTTSGARHPFCEKVGSRLWVAYSQQYQDGGQDYWVIKEVSCNDGISTITWEGLTEKSGVNTYPTDFPSLSTSKVVAWAESSSTTNHWVVKADVNDSVLTLTSSDSTSKFVSILADTAVQTTPSTSTTGVYYL